MGYKLTCPFGFLISSEGTPQATPRYNSSILEDMFMEENVEFVKRTFHGWKELTEALILLKVCFNSSNWAFMN